MILEIKNTPVYIYVEINPTYKRICVEYIKEKRFEFFTDLEIKGVSKIVSGNRIGCGDRILNIWIETEADLRGELWPTPSTSS